MCQLRYSNVPGTEIGERRLKEGTRDQRFAHCCASRCREASFPIYPLHTSPAAPNQLSRTACPRTPHSHRSAADRFTSPRTRLRARLRPTAGGEGHRRATTPRSTAQPCATKRRRAPKMGPAVDAAPRRVERAGRSGATPLRAGPASEPMHSLAHQTLLSSRTLQTDRISGKRHSKVLEAVRAASRRPELPELPPLPGPC